MPQLKVWSCQCALILRLLTHLLAVLFQTVFVQGETLVPLEPLTGAKKCQADRLSMQDVSPKCGKTHRLPMHHSSVTTFQVSSRFDKQLKHRCLTRRRLEHTFYGHTRPAPSSALIVAGKLEKRTASLHLRLILQTRASGLAPRLKWFVSTAVQRKQSHRVP